MREAAVLTYTHHIIMKVISTIERCNIQGVSKKRGMDKRFRPI